MKIEFKPHYSLEIQACTTEILTALFTKLLPLILADLYQVALQAFAKKFIEQKKLPFPCRCGNDKHFIWKTQAGKLTSLTTIWGDIQVPQLQIQCQLCSKKMYLTRKLLELKPRQKLSKDIARKMALLGATTSYRCAETIAKVFGSGISKSTIWRSVQSVGEEINFGLDTEELPEGMADGTGVPIQGIKKRGRELKVFAQKKKKGGIRIAGIGIGKYESGWDKVFSPLKEQFEEMGKFHMTLDGDCAILKGFDADIELTVQRCLWHIPHQIKYYLWKDGVKHKSPLWLKVMSATILLVSLPLEMPENEELTTTLLEEKQDAYEALLETLKEAECNNCITHLDNARDNLFTCLEKKMGGKTTSLIERLMRTVNLRINLGKWKEKSALNLLKIRLAHYYNGYDYGLDLVDEVIAKRIHIKA